ncbi:hypothetical protein FRC07_002334 [Ceratobasidium sp. 392]|nr:hypothetical protein FRC07_002334 [Ceratobasidium sp. 392]
MVRADLMETIPVQYQLGHKNTFNSVEKKWLIDTFLQEFRKSKDKSNVTAILDVGKNQASAMKAKMLQAFVEQFPYRDPNGRLDPSDTEAAALREVLCWDDPAEWSAAPHRMCNWMHKQKRKPATGSGKRKTTSQAPAKSAGSSRSAVAATEEGDIDELEEEDDPYKPDPAHLRVENETWQYFMNNTTTAWSAIAPEELVSRQKRLLEDLEKALRALSRATGAEMVLYGVLEQEGVLKSIEQVHAILSKQINLTHACRVTTPRANRWLADQSNDITRQEFTWFVARKIGPPLCTDVLNPAQTVYGDPERGYDPIYPISQCSIPQHMRLTDLFLRYKWQWGGGRGDVPYELIEEDARSGRYAMTSPDRYPAGITVLTSPYKMSNNDVISWANHFVAGQQGDIDPEFCWMFMQTRPGKFETGTRTEMSSTSRLQFLPESEAYLGFLENRPAMEDLANNKEELPVATEQRPYMSLSSDRVAQLKEDVGSDTVYAELLDEFVEFEKSWPAMYPAEFYGELLKLLPMLPDKPPSGLDELNILDQEDGGFISPRFYLQDDDENTKWCLFSVLSGCSKEQYVHPPSMTLYGGPFGVKWAVLILCFLRLNELLLERSDVKQLDIYDKVEAEFTKKDAREVRIAAGNLKKALYTSRLRLRKTLPDCSYRSEPTGRRDLFNFKDEDVARVKCSALGVWADEWTEAKIARPATAEEAAALKAPKRPAEHGELPPKKSQRTKIAGMGKKRPEKSEEGVQSADVRTTRLSSRRRAQSSTRHKSESLSAEDSKSDDSPQDEFMGDSSGGEVEEMESESVQDEIGKAGPSKKKQSARQQRQGAVEVSLPPPSSTTSAAPPRRSGRMPKKLELGRERRRMQMSYPVLREPEEPAQKAAELLLHCANVDLTEDQVTQIPVPMCETIEATIGLAHEVVQMVTGAVIYMVAAWEDGDSDIKVAQWIPNRIEYNTTGPAIYPSEQSDLQPRLPPQDPKLEQEVDRVNEYMQALSVWQGTKDLS